MQRRPRNGVSKRRANAKASAVQRTPQPKLLLPTAALLTITQMIAAAKKPRAKAKRGSPNTPKRSSPKPREWLMDAQSAPWPVTVILSYLS